MVSKSTVMVGTRRDEKSPVLEMIVFNESAESRVAVKVMLSIHIRTAIIVLLTHLHLHSSSFKSLIEINHNKQAFLNI